MGVNTTIFIVYGTFLGKVSEGKKLFPSFKNFAQKIGLKNQPNPYESEDDYFTSIYSEIADDYNSDATSIPGTPYRLMMFDNAEDGIYFYIELGHVEVFSSLNDEIKTVKINNEPTHEKFSHFYKNIS